MNDFWCDVKTNIISDFLFIIIIVAIAVILYWLIRLLKIDPASRFFGLVFRKNAKIYVSGFPHTGLVTQCAVNALEYKSAVKLRESLLLSTLEGFPLRITRWFTSLASWEVELPGWDIDIAPLESVDRPPPERSLILVGGVLANKLTEFFLSEDATYLYNSKENCYEILENGMYVKIENGDSFGYIEKVILDRYTVIIAHGIGEEQTAKAMEYLAQNWKTLYRKYDHDTFAIQVP